MKLPKIPILCLVFLICATLLPVVNGQFSQIKDWFLSLFHSSSSSKIKDKVTKELGNLDRPLDVLLSDVRNFTRPLDEVLWCYDSNLGSRQLDIFNGSRNFKSLAIAYYKAFPLKNVTQQSLSNLLNSTREMITHCFDPYQRSSIRLGFTELSDKSLEDMGRMLGFREPSNQFSSNNRGSSNNQFSSNNQGSSNNRGKRLSGNDNECIPDQSTPPPQTYDWRDFGMVTSVKSQGACGSDWAFAITGAIESALLVRQRTLQTNESLNLSEQQLVNCVNESGCSGGNAMDALSYVKQYGHGEEKVVPYTGSEEACPYAKIDHFYPLSDYCVRSRFRYGYQALTENMSDYEMQRILSQVGPLAVAIDLNASLFRNYRSGVIDERQCSQQVNHAALLVGYTQTAWILKNSFSDKWGEKGYLRLAKGKNMCGINSEIAWPII